MKKPEDDINNWIKRQVEENPQEPPEAAWQQISESLDLENAWQGINQELELDNLWTNIDNRLQVYGQIQRWERAGYAVAGAIAVLLLSLPLFLQLQETDTASLANKEKTTSSQQLTTAEKQHVPSAANAVPAVADTNLPAGQAGNNNSATASIAPGERTENGGTSAAEGKSAGNAPVQLPELAGLSTKHERAEAKKAGQASAARGFSGKTGATYSLNRSSKEIEAGKNKISWPEAGQSGKYLTSISSPGLLHYPLAGVKPYFSFEEPTIGLPVITLKKEETVVTPSRKNAEAGPWRVGVGVAARMSWLLNEKTFNAMEKSTLTTSLPAYRKSIFLQAEKGINHKLAVLSDLAVYSEAGQRYEEYQAGVYGTTDTRMQYSQLAVLAAYSPRGRGLLIRPHARYLAGVSGGYLHAARETGPSGVTDLTAEYRRTAAAVVLGYEYNFPVSKRVWVNYGVRGHLDIFNIYGGSGDIPAAFRHTRSTFLDFNLGFKYEL